MSSPRGVELDKDMCRLHGAHAKTTTPYPPDAIFRRYKRMAARLKPPVNTHIHALRHFSATELLSAGVDLRTVAGVWAMVAAERRRSACTRPGAASDRKAAEILGSRLPKRPPKGSAEE